MSSTSLTSPTDSTMSSGLLVQSPYGYIPTAWVCVMFIALFAISTIGHITQAIKWRMWWLFPTVVLAGTGEIIGWGGRFWSSQQIRSDGFLIQITTTIISPTPLVAANFIILSMVVSALGPQYSRLAPRLYSRIFLSCDVIALVVQAAGGAMASMANTREGAETGSKIMLGGIFFQLIAITAYIGLATEFFTRLFSRKAIRSEVLEHTRDAETGSSTTLIGGNGSLAPSQSEKRAIIEREIDTRMKLMIFGLCLSTLVIYIRSIYRTVELSDGWSGRIIQTQVYFNVLDGAMIVLAMYCLNFFHPGHLIRK